eukprot:jgi/Psemu1/26147/gm1.26147_g
MLCYQGNSYSRWPDPRNQYDPRCHCCHHHHPAGLLSRVSSAHATTGAPGESPPYRGRKRNGTITGTGTGTGTRLLEIEEDSPSHATAVHLRHLDGVHDAHPVPASTKRPYYSAGSVYERKKEKQTTASERFPDPSVPAYRSSGDSTRFDSIEFDWIGFDSPWTGSPWTGAAATAPTTRVATLAETKTPNSPNCGQTGTILAASHLPDPLPHPLRLHLPHRAVLARAASTAAAELPPRFHPFKPREAPHRPVPKVTSQTRPDRIPKTLWFCGTASRAEVAFSFEREKRDETRSVAPGASCRSGHETGSEQLVPATY